MVVLNTPIKIQNDRKETIQIFSLLYEHDMQERNDVVYLIYGRIVFIGYGISTIFLCNFTGRRFL